MFPMSYKIDFTTFEYNTGEQAVGKWIDGKTIYKKTLSFDHLGDNTNLQIAHNITNLGSVIKVEGSWYDTQDSRWQYVPRIDSATIIVAIAGVTSTHLLVKCTGIQWSTRTNKCNFTLYYTKSN